MAFSVLATSMIPRQAAKTPRTRRPAKDRIGSMANIPELLDGHISLEVECLDRLYLNGYIGKLATGPQLAYFMRQQLGKPVPSPVVLGQITERFRNAVKDLAHREQIPLHEFKHKEDKDETGNRFRR